MPRLWTDTIEAHRAAVRVAIMDITAALVAAEGLRSVTMSQIAKEVGIGRATLYKYFPDVDAILHAWHERQIEDHLAQLGELANQAGDPARHLESLLTTYALIQHEHHGTELAGLLHRREDMAHAEQRLVGLIEHLIAEGARMGDLRSDVPAKELANYCLHALTAASSLPSKAAVQRLVAVILTALRPASPVP